MNIDRYLRRTKRGSWKLRLSYSPPNMKADRVEIGLRTRDLTTARIAAVAIVNSMHAINARNKYFLGLIRPMDKASLSCTKRALRSRYREQQPEEKTKPANVEEAKQLVLSLIDRHFN